MRSAAFKMLAVASATAVSTLMAPMLGGASVASAATPCGSSGQYSVSGATATCTYTSAGSEDTFSVPAWVSSLDVTAVGASGGGFDGGIGAQVTNTALPVAAGGTLWVDVAYQDGGSGVLGNGGSSSALLITPRASATLSGDPTTDSRLLVAGGGGGTLTPIAYVGAGGGGNAGDPTVTGGGAGGCDSNDGGSGGVGPTDGRSGGGSGCFPGSAGTATSGGAGDSGGGGGGGGGWFGGGGGGYGGGGGGGSSYGGRTTGTVSVATASSSQVPEVVISWPALTASLLCGMTVQDVQGSGRYEVSSPAARRGVDRLVSEACLWASGLVPGLSATEQARPLGAYDRSVQFLALTGWLTGQQAAQLTGLAATLSGTPAR